EAWLTRFPGADSSIHLELFPETPDAWRDDALARKWADIRTLRRVVTGALEVDRREKRIGASLQAAVTVYVEDARYRDAFAGVDLAETFITSDAEIVVGTVPEGAFRLEDVDGI